MAGDVGEVDGTVTETVGARPSTTEAIGTLEAALRKGAGVHRIAIATIETGIRRQI